MWRHRRVKMRIVNGYMQCPTCKTWFPSKGAMDYITKHGKCDKCKLRDKELRIVKEALNA
jgi:tRNA(Ile2) C34 agmatinyltransferase TiaS